MTSPYGHVPAHTPHWMQVRRFRPWGDSRRLSRVISVAASAGSVVVRAMGSLLARAPFGPPRRLRIVVGVRVPKDEVVLRFELRVVSSVRVGEVPEHVVPGQ